MRRMPKTLCNAKKLSGIRIPQLPLA